MVGCDISVDRNGIFDSGRETFPRALGSFNGKDQSTLTSLLFVEALLEHSTAKVRGRYSDGYITDEL